MKRAVAALALIPALLVTAAWFVSFDASLVGGTLLRQSGAATGLALDASRARWNLVRGIELEDVVASSSFPSGRYEVTIARMRFEHRLVPLLQGELDVERVVLARPRVELLYGLPFERAAPAERTGSGRRHRGGRGVPDGAEREASSRRELRFDELVLRDATILVRDARRDSEGASLTGIELSLREPKLDSGALTLIHGVRAAGRLGASELRLGGTTLSAVDAGIKMAAGKMDLAGSFRTEHGDFDGSVQVDFNSLPFRHRVSMSGRLREVAADVSIDAEGFGLDPADLKGGGKLDIHADAPLWNRPELEGVARRGEPIFFRIEKGRILVEGNRHIGSIDQDGRLIWETP